MELYDKVQRYIPDVLGIPDQTLPGVPIIEIYGTERVLIEGRCRIVQYDDQCICLSNSCGTVHVTGGGLQVAELSVSRLIIIGSICGVSICRG